VTRWGSYPWLDQFNPDTFSHFSYYYEFSDVRASSFQTSGEAFLFAYNSRFFHRIIVMPTNSQIRTEQRRVQGQQVVQDSRTQNINLRLERELNILRRLIGSASGAIPKRKTITAADSPYNAPENTLVICDMSTGDIDVYYPLNSIYGVSVAKKGDDGTLMVYPGSGRTIEGDVSAEILNDGDCLTAKFDGTSDWRGV